MTYTGTLAGTFGTVPALPANFTLDYGTGTNSTIKLLFTTTTDVWDGTLNGNWNTTDANWKTLAAFANLHKVLIDDTAAGPNTDIVINGGNVSPFSVTVNNGGVYPNYSITGSAGNAIIGTGSLTKNGTGTLTLSGPHTYSGGTNVNNGTLRLGASNSLPDVGAVTVAASGVLDMNGMTDSIGTLSVDGNVLAGNLTTTGAVTLGDGASVAANLTLGGNVTKNGTVGATISGNINLNGARTFTIASGTAPELALNGVVSNGALTKSGDGTLLLNNAGNNYAGATIVSGGILKVGVAGALPAGTALTMNAGTLDGKDTAISLSSLTGVAGTTLSLGSGSLAVAQAGNTTFAGDITGSASVTKTLGGRLTLSGTASDYSGGLFVNGGAVIATSFNAPGSGTVTVNPGGTFQAGAGLGNAIVLQGGTLATTLPNTTQLTFGDLTAATGTTSTIRLSDSVNFATVGDAIIGGTLLGSGNLAVVSNQAGADGGSGFRLRGTGTSDYSGTITVGNAVKFELQSRHHGRFQPDGHRQVVLTCRDHGHPRQPARHLLANQHAPNAAGTVHLRQQRRNHRRGRGQYQCPRRRRHHRRHGRPQDRRRPEHLLQQERRRHRSHRRVPDRHTHRRNPDLLGL
jgi:autotransporter-associated beta strand protein